jgi:glycerophosphoryl diester phosphodiesterase
MRTLTWPMMEIKPDTAARLEQIIPMAAEAVRQRGMTERVTLSSFDPTALEISKRVCPEIRRAFTGSWDAWFYLERALELGCGQAHVYQALAKPEIVRAARSEGLQIMVWTTNTEEELERTLRLDPDFICTDVPTTLRERLAG